jgi:hypothetical protein
MQNQHRFILGVTQSGVAQPQFGQDFTRVELEIFDVPTAVLRRLLRLQGTAETQPKQTRTGPEK